MALMHRCSGTVSTCAYCLRSSPACLLRTSCRPASVCTAVQSRCTPGNPDTCSSTAATLASSSGCARRCHLVLAAAHRRVKRVRTGLLGSLLLQLFSTLRLRIALRLDTRPARSLQRVCTRTAVRMLAFGSEIFTEDNTGCVRGGIAHAAIRFKKAAVTEEPANDSRRSQEPSGYSLQAAS